MITHFVTAPFLYEVGIKEIVCMAKRVVRSGVFLLPPYIASVGANGEQYE